MSVSADNFDKLSTKIDEAYYALLDAILARKDVEVLTKTKV